METQTLALPVQCSKCGNVFDLGYDIAQAENMEKMEEVLKAIRAGYIQIPLLCWDCRN